MKHIHWLQYAVANSILLAAHVASASDCVAPAQRQLQLFDLEIAGLARVTRAVELPAGASALVEAVEQNINTRLEVREPGASARVSDNPLRRWAPQRLLIPPGPARSIEVAVIGQERSHGTAQVRVFRFVPDENPPCTNFWRAMANADADFARGELISGGTVDAPAGSADRAYEGASRGYLSAAETARAIGGFTLAQAQLTYAAAEIIGTEGWENAAKAAREADAGFAALGHDYGRDRAQFFWARSQLQLALHATSQAESDRLFQAAHDALLSVADHHRQRGERYDHAFALSWVAFGEASAEHYAESIPAWQRARAAFEPLDEPARKVQARQGLANSEFELGRFPEALEHYSEALQAVDPVAEIGLYAVIISNIAFTEYRLGKHDAALRHYSELLALGTRVQNLSNRVFALHGLGITYHAIGNFTEALAYLRRALELRTVQLDPLGRSNTLRGIANVLRDMGRWREAIERREEALSISQAPLQRARISVDLARDYLDSGDVAAAKRLIADLLADAKISDPIIRTRVIMQSARVELAEGKLDAAAEDVASVVNYFGAQEMTVAEFDALLLQARVACARGNRAAAMDVAERAMQRAEEIRVSSNNPTLRASLWRPLRPAFDFTIGMLANPASCGGSVAADAIGALAIAEKSRNRALEDFRRQAGAGGDSLAAARGRRRELFEQVASRRQQIEALVDRARQGDARLKILREEIANLRREIDLSGGEVAVPPIRSSDLRRALRAKIDVIPADTAAVEYWLGNERTYAWLVTRKRVQFVNLGPTQRIDAAARALHEAMRAWTTVGIEERLRLSRELHALLIAPLPAELAHARTVYFIPDGALHAVPFAALASGSGAQLHFLVDSHDVAVASNLSAVGTGSEAPRIARGGTALVVADPVYASNDSRFGARAEGKDAAPQPMATLRGAQTWARLPASAGEAVTIAKLLGPGSVEVLSGFAASRERLLEHSFEKYQIVHFAVHAIADTEAPQLSALILSTVDVNGKARAGEVFAGDLLDRRTHADLVVLSGCDTALGHSSAGEGLLGMRYAAHAAGARTVIASLWPVVDAAGAGIIDDLYAGVIGQQLTPVAALSRAMRAARRKWVDPALWGVFDVSNAAAW